MSQEKAKRDLGVGAQHHSPQLILSHMLMGTVAVLALILKGLVDQRMVKEGLVLYCIRGFIQCSGFNSCCTQIIGKVMALTHRPWLFVIRK